MRNLILHNWKIKLACLAMGTLVWYLIQRNIATDPPSSRFRFEAPAAPSFRP